MLEFSTLPLLDLTDPLRGQFKYQSSQFPGGEQFIRIDLESASQQDPSVPTLIFTRLRNGDDVMKLLMAKNAMNQLGFDVRAAVLPYFPYGRQDRIVNSGESFSVKVFAQLVNDHFDAIITLDNHSPVTTAVLDANMEFSSHRAVADWIAKTLTPQTDGGVWDNQHEEIVILAPDAGAVKRAEKVAKELKVKHPNWGIEVRYATKKRDLLSGKVLEVNCPKINNNEHVFVIDDICDGGRTFMELASDIRAGKDQPISLNLYVTHGIFSKGLEALFGYYDRIATTDSFFSAAEYHDRFETYPKFHVINLFDAEPKTQSETEDTAK